MLPERFGRYEVLAEIGDGAMGRVYTAWDPAVSRVVAVKTIKAEYRTGEKADEYMKRFGREVRAAGGLSHAAIVRVYDGGDDYVVMEYVEGRTIKALLREQGRLEPREALRLLGPIAEAVDLAHAAGLVHRDIKPANIMVQLDGQPKLMDFGVVHVEASVMTAAGQILGSPSYMSPEQIMGAEATSAFDVYSLAVVAYEMLTGQPPFQGATITQVIYRVMHDQPPPPRMWNAALPARYDEVFACALAKDPARRFSTAGELVAALDLKELEFAFSSAAGAAPAAEAAGRDSTPLDDQQTLLSPARRASAPSRRGRAVKAALAAAAAVLLAAGWLSLRPDPLPTTPSASPPTPGPVAALPSGAPESGPGRPAAPDPRPTARPTAFKSTEARGRPDSSKRLEPLEGQIVEIGPSVTPPKRVSGQAAAYPSRARALRQFGTVVVGLLVDENGSPSDIQVVQSAGPILDEAVLEAVRSWRFEPATKDGVGVKVRWTVKQSYEPAR